MTPEELRQLSEAIQAATGAYTAETAEMRARREQEEASVARSKAVDDAAVKAGMAAVAALGSFSKSLLSTEAGMSKYNSALSSAGNAAMDIGKNFGVLGIAIGGFVKLITLGAELVLKQNDAMIKAYDTLSEFGATTTLTSRDILKIGTASGFTSHNLEIFAKHAASLGTDFQSLGGNATAGFEAFGKLTKITQEQRNQYNRLGWSQEMVLKGQADYVKISAASATALSKNPKILQEASLKYIDALTELSALTGASAEEQKDIQKNAAANISYSTHNTKLEIERAELLKKSKEMAGTVEGDAARKRADAILRQLEAEKKIITETGTTFGAGSKMQTGILQRIASGGKAWTEESATLLTRFGNLSKVIDKAVIGEYELGEAKTAANKDSIQNVNSFGTLIGIVSANADDLGISVKSNTELVKTYGIDQRKEGEIQRAELLKKKMGLGMFDKAKDAQESQLTVELQARKAMDELSNTISGPVTSAFKGLTSAMNVFGRGIGKIIEWIGVMLPGSGVSEAGKKIQAQFRDPEEIKERNEQIKAEKEALQAKVQRDIKASQEQTDDYKEAFAREKKSKQQLADADTKLAIARDKEAKATDPEEKKKLHREVSAALLEKSAATNTHTADKKYLEKSKVTNPLVHQIANANKKIAELDAELKDNKKALSTITGEPESEKIDVKNDAIFKELSKAIDDKKKIITSIAYDEEIAFDKEHLSIEATTKEKEEFKRKLDAKTQKIREELSDLEDKKTNREKELKKKEDSRIIEEAKKADAAYEKRQQETRSATTRSTPETSSNKGTKPAAKERKEFYDKMYEVLLTEAKKAKLENPESVAHLGASQSSLETGYGKSLAGGNNYFGIKAKAGQKSSSVSTQEFVNGKMVTVNDSFRKYNDDSGKESAADYIKFLQENARYKKVLAAKTKEEAIREQAKTGYATDPAYGTKLESISKSMAQPAGPQAPVTAQAPAAEKKKPSMADAVAYGEQYAAVKEPLKPARDGGLFSGPASGYPVELHGTEVVIPMAELKPVGKKELNQIQPSDFAKTDATSAVEKQTTASTVTPVAPASAPTQDKSGGLTVEMVAMLSEKLDTMIAKLSDSNDTQEQLLRHSRA